MIAARVPNSSKMGRVSLWEIRVNVRFAWIFFRFGVVVFHIGNDEIACNGADLLFPVYEQALSKGVPVWHSK